LPFHSLHLYASWSGDLTDADRRLKRSRSFPAMQD
jgi:hypothetical protein